MDPVGRTRLWEWLSAKHKDAINAGRTRPNGHANGEADNGPGPFDEAKPNGHKGAGDSKGAEALPPLHIINVASFAGKPVPQREWFVPDVIIADRVTIISGNGGDGKSLLAQQLSVATVTATDWIGYLPKQGGVLYASAEDGPDEIHRRLTDIIAGRDDLSFEAMKGFNIICAANQTVWERLRLSGDKSRKLLSAMFEHSGAGCRL